MPEFVTRDGATLHYYDVGRGPLCVMLHGFGMSSELWLPLVAPLLSRQRFVLLSQRGFGRSHGQSFSDDCIMVQLAEDLEDLLNHLQVDQCHLAGYSMGACASMQFLSNHSHERISAYLQIDQAACVANKADWKWGVFGEQHESWMLNLAELLTQADIDAPFKSLPSATRRQICSAFADFFEVAAHKRWLRAGSRLINFEPFIQAMLPTHNWPVYLHCMKAYATQSYDFRVGMAKVGLPIWNFVGDRSRMYDATGQLKLGQIVAGDVTNIHFAHCGHALPFEAPRAFTRRLGRFLATA